MPHRASPHLSAENVSWLEWLVAGVIGIGLAVGMWHGLLTDQDLVGGDTWSYFFPQKMLLADGLRNGRIPLWHDLSGLGYPLLAESQAGVFYPSNQVLYRLFETNQAYYVSIVLHYALAFVFAWRFARCQLLSNWTALLAAMIFVYGWFPARISLEWSIIGGVWLPLTLWQTHEFLNRPSRWRFSLLATCLAVHLLAGHYTLAFINQLTLIGYAGLQYALRPQEERPSWTRVAAVPAAILVSMVLSGIQLLPTTELKLTSQREGVTKNFDPGYGHLPPLYLSQLVASWTWWHTPEIKHSGKMQRLPGSIGSDTNAVEAHFYLGLIPFLLALCCVIPGLIRRVPPVPRNCWSIICLVSVIYATGWLLPVTRHLPGFSFFMGPGRYTIVATLGAAILCGLALDSIVRRGLSRAIVVLVIAGLTWPDLQWSSTSIADAHQVPAIWPHREHSWVRDYFQQQPARSCRLLMSGPNVGNLFGVSCVPQYLGLGPSVYYGDEFKINTKLKTDPTPDELAQMQAIGITHVLTTEPIAEPTVELQLVNGQPDRFLNAVWGRGGTPCFLYELSHPGQRVTAEPESALAFWKCVEDVPEELSIDLTLNEPAIVRLAELDYPGWSATIDGQPVGSKAADKLHRAVRVDAGQHRLNWRYNPAGYRFGRWLSLISLVVVWSTPFVRFNRSPSKETDA